MKDNFRFSAHTIENGGFELLKNLFGQFTKDFGNGIFSVEDSENEGEKSYTLFFESFNFDILKSAGLNKCNIYEAKRIKKELLYRVYISKGLVGLMELNQIFGGMLQEDSEEGINAILCKSVFTAGSNNFRIN